MKSCRVAPAIGAVFLLGAAATNACREPERPAIPPLTVAAPAASPADAPAPARATVAAAAPPAKVLLPPVAAAFVELPSTLDAAACTRILVAIVKGKMSALGESLGAGDVLVLDQPNATELAGAGLALVARRAYDCAALAKPAPTKTVVRASSSPDLVWASGTMHAHLDVGAKVSPQVYLGRLEGTAAVAEHTHAGTWEVLAAVEAAGTFILDGREQRMGPRQVVAVPPDTKHAWRPDPGSKLVAIQLYDPPGPEQRFVALAGAAQKNPK